MSRSPIPAGAWTPGPWLFEHRKTAVSEGMYSTEIFTDDGGSGKGVIATCSWYPKPLDERGAIGTYREENARLMAKAPELYDAAIEFLAAWWAGQTRESAEHLAVALGRVLREARRAQPERADA